MGEQSVSAATGMVIMVVTMSLVFQYCEAKTTTVVEWNPAYEKKSLSLKKNDIVVFNFDPRMHSLLEVNSAGHTACNTANPIKTFQPGQAIKFSAPGTRYFICGVPTHCVPNKNQGMKLLITTK